MTRFFHFIFFFAIPFLLLFFATRGVVIHDEGYILHYAQRISQGELPYRDFHFVYTPGSIFLTAFFFKILGTSILSSRLLMAGLAYLSSLMLFRIVKSATKNTFLSYASVAIFIFWGFAHTNFTWPVMFAIATLVTSLYFFERKKYLLVGVFVFATFLFKQNFGPVLFLGLFPVFFFLENKQKTKHLKNFLLGIFLPAIVFIIFLYATNTLHGLVSDMNEFTVQRILKDKDLNTQFLYIDTFFKTSARAFIYSLVPIASLYAIFLLWKNNKKELLGIPLSVLGFYIVGIRPTTDYIHLTPLLSLVGLPLSIILRFSRKYLLNFFIGALMLILIFVGLYTSLFKGYYRWDSPLIEHNRKVAFDRAAVRMNNRSAEMFGKLNQTIQDETGRMDYIYVYYYAPMIYFLSERKALPGYDFLENDVDFYRYQTLTVSSLEKYQVKLVITGKNIDEQIPVLNYIRQNFKIVKVVSDFVIWKRDNYLAKGFKSY